MSTSSDRARLLRRSLQTDGIASGLCGVVLLVDARPISVLIGLADLSVDRLVGAPLVLYAAALLWNAARAEVSRGGAVAGVAAAVLLFLVLEVVGLNRLSEAAGWGARTERWPPRTIGSRRPPRGPR